MYMGRTDFDVITGPVVKSAYFQGVYTATPQTIVLTQFVVLQMHAINSLEILILQPALSDVKIGPARAYSRAHENGQSKKRNVFRL